MNTSPAHLSRYELTRVIEILTSMISSSKNGFVLNHEVKNLNPILAAIIMFRELKPDTLEVSRELIPNDKSTVEKFDVQKMTYDELFLRETEEFLSHNTLDRNKFLEKKSDGEKEILGQIRLSEKTAAYKSIVNQYE